MRPMPFVQLDFTDGASLSDVAPHLRKWETNQPDQENVL